MTIIKDGFGSIWNLKLNANVNFMIKKTAIFILQMTKEWGHCVNKNLGICFHFKLLPSKHIVNALLSLSWFNDVEANCHWSKRMLHYQLIPTRK